MIESLVPPFTDPRLGVMSSTRSGIVSKSPSPLSVNTTPSLLISSSTLVLASAAKCLPAIKHPMLDELKYRARTAG